MVRLLQPGERGSPVYENEVCPNCECELEGDCCGAGRSFLLDEMKYCCEPCAVDGECECGCVANPIPPPTEEGKEPTGPLLAGPTGT